MIHIFINKVFLNIIVKGKINCYSLSNSGANMTGLGKHICTTVYKEKQQNSTVYKKQQTKFNCLQKLTILHICYLNLK